MAAASNLDSIPDIIKFASASKMVSIREKITIEFTCRYDHGPLEFPQKQPLPDTNAPLSQ